MRLLTALLVLAVFTAGFGLGGMIALNFPGGEPVLATQTVLHRGLSSSAAQVSGEVADSSLSAVKTTPDEYSWPQERPSPSDWISEEQIHLGQEKVCFDMPTGYTAEWATFADTNSMDPVFDQGSHAIQLKPHSISDIKVGDIITFDTEFGKIIHRVVEIGYDEDGWYCLTKGDNNRYPDGIKVRFEDISKEVVAIIY
ncbi:signal peptidase I [Candidatus Woesearchaeota archaeon]|nr:signal peptidase I [Candidatus Woesearchaeota archaeon]